MATMSVISWANLLQDSLLFIHKKNGLNSISSWRRCLDRGVFTLFACFLLGQSANAQNFRMLRGITLQSDCERSSTVSFTFTSRNILKFCALAD